MNDNILRGFCQKCEWPIHYINYPTHTELSPQEYKYNRSNCVEVVPIWFLSAKQIKIVEHSKGFKEWCYDDGQETHPYHSINSLHTFLKDEPFLVTKILKEQGQDVK